MMTYLVATHEPPAIICPTWCAIPVEEHIEALRDWEGMVIHWTDDRDLGGGFTARAAASMTPAGSPDPREPMMLHLCAPNEALMQDVAALGQALIDLAAEVHP